MSDPYAGLYDVEAERAVAGAALFTRTTCTQAQAQVSAEDFHRPALRALFAAACDCWAAGETPGPFTLPSRPGWDRDAYSVAVAAFTGNVNRPCARVADLASRRRLVDAAAALEAAARDQTVDLADVLTDQQARLAGAHTPMSSVEPGPDVDVFLAENTDEDWLVPGLLERGERVILTGAEGRGKSTCLRQVAVQAAAGVKPFTCVRMNPPVRAMIVDCENSPGQVRRQLGPLRAKVPFMDAARLVVLCRPQGLDLSHRQDRRWLEERIVANRPDIIVTGPLYKLHAGDPIEERPAANLRDLFDTLRVRYGFALLIEAHQPYAPSGSKDRPLRPYGASLWSRWPEVGIGLLENEKEKRWTLAEWRGMREERPGWPAELVRNGRWPWLAA